MDRQREKAEHQDASTPAARSHGADAATRPSPLRALQRLAGNRAVTGLITAQRHLGPTTFEDLGMEPTGGGGGGGGGARRRSEAAVSPGEGATATETKPAELDYAAIARRIRDAVEGLGTDEEAVYKALREVGPNDARMQALREAYVELTGRTLDADLADDLDGVELVWARALMGGSREQRVRNQMRRTTQGVWALGVIDGRNITVDWAFTGTGSFHQGGNIYLNYRKPSIPAALTMVHEAQHAETFKAGRSPDATKVDRNTFVTRMIADEAEASTKQMEAALGMTSQGVATSDTGQQQWMLDRFKRAYDDEVKRLTDEGVAEAEIPKRARDAVRDGLVTNWFKDGTYRTSTSGSAALTYEQHYQAEWDRLNNVGKSE